MTNQVVCPQCGNSSIDNKFEDYLMCANCSTNFPILFDNIPILVKDPQRFLAEAYIIYNKHLEAISSKCRLLTASNNSRFALRVDAIKTNIKYINALIQEIESKLNHKDIALTSVHQTNYSYFNDFRYLRRDWSGEEETEEEVGNIVQVLRKAIDPHIKKNEISLFIGGATGRITIDLLEYFKQSIIMDRSITMAKMFHDLMKGDIEFCDIRYKNSLSVEKLLNYYKVNIQNIVPEFSQQEKLNYIVSDAKFIPFNSDYFGSIFSIYFTDVLPITTIIKQVIRLLKPGGLFVHFGPLEYHFNSIEYMLSAEEIHDIFEDLGFEILVNETTDYIPHLYSKGSLLKKSYKNWVFVCRKNNIKVDL